jgi:DNA-binding response OmpR family regulator
MSATDSGPAAQPSITNARILVVDDEDSIRTALGRLFTRLGHQVSEAASGPEALTHLARENFDLVILDLKMPDMEGTEVLQAAQAVAPDTVFIILTAYGTLDSAIIGVRHGAFDYLLKPSPVEDIVRAVESGLTERQRRLQREDPLTMLEQALATIKSAPQQPKKEPSKERFLQVRDITLDTLRRLVVAGDDPIILTATEFDILAYLLRYRNRVISCSELVANVRGYDLDERDARALLRSHIHRLRHKIEPDPANPQTIRTVRGSGYIVVE